MKPSERRDSEAKRLPVSRFWGQRNIGAHVELDELTVHNVSIFLAYAAYRLKLSPNQVSLASGFFSVVTLFAGIVLPDDRPVYAILAIFGLAQFSYLLDCADGQLARITQSVSVFGSFLDKSMDLSGTMLQFGALFIFAYRHFTALGDTTQAEVYLFGGLVFLFLKVSRFSVWQFFINMLPDTYEESRTSENLPATLLKNFMDQQISLLNILVFLISPALCLAIFLAQGSLLGYAWLRYFWRAKDS